MTMPAARSRAATAASRVGTWLRSEGDPAVVVTPATSKQSLMVHGTPWNGPRHSRRAAASSAAPPPPPRRARLARGPRPLRRVAREGHHRVELAVVLLDAVQHARGQLE